LGLRGLTFALQANVLDKHEQHDQDDHRPDADLSNLASFHRDLLALWSWATSNTRREGWPAPASEGNLVTPVETLVFDAAV
jgi:hypothetical protein